MYMIIYDHIFINMCMNAYVHNAGWWFNTFL